jgi:hypothetical protein
MINFNLHSFLIGRATVWNEMEGARVASEKNRNEEVSPSLTGSIERRVHLAMQECALVLDMDGVEDTCLRLERLFNNWIYHHYTWGELHELLKRLWEGMESQLGYEFFCHYSREEGEELEFVPVNWRDAIKAFPSAESEIRWGVDCFALGNYAGCVFHMCRVGEIGLRTIGRERGIKKLKNKRTPIDFATWGEVLEAIEPTLEEIRKKKSRGPQKEAALKFYSTILSDLRAIQSYRDHSMHFHDSYDMGQAQSAKFRVKELMNMLASKLDESSNRAIPWSAWK